MRSSDEDSKDTVAPLVGMPGMESLCASSDMWEQASEGNSTLPSAQHGLKPSAELIETNQRPINEIKKEIRQALHVGNTLSGGEMQFGQVNVASLVSDMQRITRKAEEKAVQLAAEEELLQAVTQQAALVHETTHGARQRQMLESMFITNHLEYPALGRQADCKQQQKRGHARSSYDLELRDSIHKHLNFLVDLCSRAGTEVPKQEEGSVVVQVCYVPVIFAKSVRLKRSDMRRTMFRMNDMSIFADLEHEIQNWVVSRPGDVFEIYSPENRRLWDRQLAIGRELRKSKDALAAIVIRRVKDSRTHELKKDASRKESQEVQHQIEQLKSKLADFAADPGQSLNATITRLLVHAIFLATLLIDIYQRHYISRQFQLQQAIADKLLLPTVVTEFEPLSLEQLMSIWDVWAWLEGPLVEALTIDVIPQGEEPTEDDLLSPGIIANYNELFGPLRLQQLRAVNASSTTTAATFYGELADVFSSVLPKSLQSELDTAPFPARFEEDPRVGQPGFVHSSTFSDGPYPRGDLAEFPSAYSSGRDTYPPHGYIRDVFAAKDYARAIAGLRAGDWLDHYTTALLVKFTLRAHNLGSTSSVKIFFEFDRNGAVHTDLHVRTMDNQTFEDEHPGLAWLCNATLLFTVAYIVWRPLRSRLQDILAGRATVFAVVFHPDFFMYCVIIATTMYKYAVVWDLTTSFRALRKRYLQLELTNGAYNASATGEFYRNFVLQNWTDQGINAEALWLESSVQEWPTGWPGQWDDITPGYADLSERERDKYHIIALNCFAILFVLLSFLSISPVHWRAKRLWNALFGSRRMWLFATAFLLHAVFAWAILLNIAFQQDPNFQNVHTTVIFMLRVIIGALDRESYRLLTQTYPVTAPILVLLMTLSLYFLLASLFIGLFYDGIAYVGDVERKIEKAQRQLRSLPHGHGKTKQQGNSTLSRMIGHLQGLVRSLGESGAAGLRLTRSWADYFVAEQRAMCNKDKQSLSKVRNWILRVSPGEAHAIRERKWRRLSKDKSFVDLLPWEIEAKQKKAHQKLRSGCEAVEVQQSRSSFAKKLKRARFRLGAMLREPVDMSAPRGNATNPLNSQLDRAAPKVTMTRSSFQRSFRPLFSTSRSLLGNSRRFGSFPLGNSKRFEGSDTSSFRSPRLEGGQFDTASGVCGTPVESCASGAVVVDPERERKRQMFQSADDEDDLWKSESVAQADAAPFNTRHHSAMLALHEQRLSSTYGIESNSDLLMSQRSSHCQ